MAGYVFESISDAQAASFGTNDYLFFSTAGATARNVTVAPFTSSSGVLSGSGITLTFGGASHTFNNSISAASVANHILFSDNSHLVIGTQSDTADTLAPTTNGGATLSDPYTVYALSGNDTLNFSTSAASVSNYLNGGFGADTISGGAANNHIWGNSQFSMPGDTQNGQTDGADTITATSGSNYINGNAGNDIITVGVNAVGGANPVVASTGFNRVSGGADNDTITVQGAGHNAVNGNTGNDIINDTGTGDNTLRGGQGDDIIRGGSGHSALMGDVGNDTIFVHGRNGETVAGNGVTNPQQHINVITGGAGSDTFDFTGITSAGGNANAGAGQAALFGQTVYYQEITDFTIGTDKIHLTTNPTQTGDVGHSTTIFTTVQDAEAYAQSQLSGMGFGGSHVVESLAVGSASNTYLFYAEAGNTAVNNGEVAGLGIIHLDNVVAANVTYTDFNTQGSLGS